MGSSSRGIYFTLKECYENLTFELCELLHHTLTRHFSASWYESWMWLSLFSQNSFKKFSDRVLSAAALVPTLLVTIHPDRHMWLEDSCTFYLSWCNRQFMYWYESCFSSCTILNPDFFDTHILEITCVIWYILNYICIAWSNNNFLESIAYCIIYMRYNSCISSSFFDI